MKPFALALLALALAAQPPARPGDSEKPTPRQKARQLLDSAAEMMAATTPDVQATALMHLARNYQDFDKKKAVDYFKQAFTAATTPPAGQTPFARNTQMEIVVALVTLDTGEGLALLKQIQPVNDGGYDYRSFAASRVIGELLKKDAIEQAIDLAEYMGGTGAYPFTGVSQIMAKLPAGDNQLAAVFTSALNAYVVKPDNEFHHLLMRYQKKLPAGMAEAALSKILAFILTPHDNERYASQTLSSSKGTATFTVRENMDLFDVAPLIREIDPKRYEELLANRAELRSAMQLFPGGGPSVADDRGVSIYSVSGDGKGNLTAEQQRSRDAVTTRMQTAALINARSEAALIAMATDPDKAIDLVGDIPSPPKQADVLARIAQSVGENDVAKARRVLSRCLSVLEDVKYPEDRVVAWDTVAGAAVAIKDDAILLSAVDRMLGDAAELYKEDTNGDRPNRAWRENWPSTQAYRRAIIRAVKLQGVDAEPVLQKITDPGQNVLARIAMAQALLQRPFDRLQTFGGRQRAPQLSK